MLVKIQEKSLDITNKDTISQLYLYPEITTILVEKDDNKHTINEFSEVIDTVEEFVLENIDELIQMRLR
jgi:hypothetical protein